MDAGAVVGGWTLEERLGGGGFHDVWRASPVDDEGPDVALKIPRTDEARALARREHEILSGLDHPNVVGVVELIEDGSRVALAVDLLPGGTLRERLEEAPGGRLPLPEVEAIFGDLAAGLAHAHDREVWHRDLKPSNVLFDGDGRPVLTDFDLGLGPDEDAGGPLLSGALATRVQGTAPYMAPEQLQGKPGDARADVYAAGLILFEMMTGDLPQPGDELLKARPPADVRWRKVFEHCYTREERRFADARALVEALERSPSDWLDEDDPVPGAGVADVREEFAEVRAKQREIVVGFVLLILGTFVTGGVLALGPGLPGIAVLALFLGGIGGSIGLGYIYWKTNRCPSCGAHGPTTGEESGRTYCHVCFARLMD